MGQTWNDMANETLQYPVSHVKDVALPAPMLNLPGLFWFFPPKNVETSFEPSYSRHEESWCYCIKVELIYTVSQRVWWTNFASLYPCKDFSEGTSVPPSKTWLQFLYFVFHSSWRKTPFSAFPSLFDWPAIYFIWHPAVG